ncbi:TPA: ribosome recycling factor [bacterium]|nr:ribosome recycling factor [bacterium]
MENIIENAKQRMNKTIEVFEKELSSVRTGRATSSMLDRVEVMYYGFKTPLNQVASISVQEPRLLLIKPYDKSTLKDIEKGIAEANLGFNPINDGEVIRISVPELTEDRRRDMVKIVRKINEENKVAIRNIRRDANDTIKKDKDTSEDMRRSLESEVQKLTDEFIKKIDTITSIKEKEIMTI